MSHVRASREVAKIKLGVPMASRVQHLGGAKGSRIGQRKESGLVGPEVTDRGILHWLDSEGCGGDHPFSGDSQASHISREVALMQRRRLAVCPFSVGPLGCAS